MTSPQETSVIARTQRWVDEVVIGLGLCPFAPPVVQGGTLKIVHTGVTDPEDLLREFWRHAQDLAAVSAQEVETVLLVHPACLEDFLEYNDFLAAAEGALEELGLTGELQVASFHPRYQFGGTALDDAENFTNRSPYPMLHLLREASVARALEEYGDPASIYERNIERMRALSLEALRALAAPGA